MKTILIAAAFVALLAGCTDDAKSSTSTPPDPLAIAVLMPTFDRGDLPDMSWALENINAAGGPAGRPLVLDYVDPTGKDVVALGQELADDEEHLAVIGPPGSAALSALADRFVEKNKPIISATSTSDDLLRAYGGKGPIWRTRESDIAQTELLIHFALGAGAKKITLLTSLEIGGYTFFSWFGFFARELGYAEKDVSIITLPSKEACNAKVLEVIETMPQMLFVAPGSPIDMECIVNALPPPGNPRPRIVFADTGLDANDFTKLGAAAEGIEGFTGAGDPGYSEAFLERFPGERLAPHGPSEYDALLLLAYGLEVSQGEGYQSLIHGMKEAVDGTEPSEGGWDAEGIAKTLAALRAGKRPMLSGATGMLAFEPKLYMDLASSSLGHYTVKGTELVFDKSFSTADPSFLTSEGAFVKPGLPPKDVDQSMWTPAAAKTDAWAVVGALSSGFSNYRHQSDALQQYRMLKANGFDDDHIVLILADDIASDPMNKLSGEVRNEPDGSDIYGDVVIDYGVSITAKDIQNILEGNLTATTPTVISPTASSNVYVYLAGHGGTSGIPLAAQTAEEGIAGEGAVFSPNALRESLCAMQASGSYRRALVLIESCYSGAFGEADEDGLEFGCGASAGETPLFGVTLITAANGKEVSYAGAYDSAVPAWVNDAFSRQFATNALASPSRSIADVYADAYQGTAGSHPSIFNVENAGRLSLVEIGEMLLP